jgi:hypothetical protein
MSLRLAGGTVIVALALLIAAAASADAGQFEDLKIQNRSLDGVLKSGSVQVQVIPYRALAPVPSLDTLGQTSFVLDVRRLGSKASSVRASDDRPVYSGSEPVTVQFSLNRTGRRTLAGARKTGTTAVLHVHGPTANDGFRKLK